MKSNHNFASDGDICKLHDEKWVARQRIAGKVAGQTLSLLEELVQEKTVKSLLELDQIAGEFIIANGCSATFKGYKGFPANVCMSLDNEQAHCLVHGIPTDYKLQDGDLISFDLGATFEGSIGDTAITCIYGLPKLEQHVKLIQHTQEALNKGIEAIVIGKQIGVIGNAIHRHLASKGYGTIVNYGGHSLDYDTPHAFPFVSNKAGLNEGIRLTNGMSLAIEPLSTINGSTKTWVDKDGWSVYTERTSCHFEHTIFIHQDHVEIMTARNV